MFVMIHNLFSDLSSVVLARETGLLQVNYVGVRNCVVDVIGYKHCVETARDSSYLA